MSGYAHFQQALVDMIKTEVQTAVTQQYQDEVDKLRNPLAVIQRDLESTRRNLESLRVDCAAVEDRLSIARSDLDNVLHPFNPSLSVSFDATNSGVDAVTGADDAADDDIITTLHPAGVQNSPAETESVAAVDTASADSMKTKPSKDALKRYANSLQLQFPRLSHACKLCGTSDPSVIQELLSEDWRGLTIPKLDSFQRLVLESHGRHPNYECLEEPDDSASDHANTSPIAPPIFRKHLPGVYILPPGPIPSRGS